MCRKIFKLHKYCLINSLNDDDEAGDIDWLVTVSTSVVIITSNRNNKRQYCHYYLTVVVIIVTCLRIIFAF